MNIAKNCPVWVRCVLTCLLAAVLAVGLLPVSAFAAGGEDGAEAPSDDVEAVSEAAAEAAEDEAALPTEEEILADAAAYAARAAIRPLAAGGEVDCRNGWALTYEIGDEGAEITGVAVEGSGALVVPDEAGGEPVVAIGDSAFNGCAALTALTLPSSVSSLGLYAFTNSGLTSIDVPEAVTRVPYRCFATCHDLAEVAFEADSMRYLGNDAFSYCTSLTEIEVPLLTDTPSREEMERDGLNDGSVSLGASIGANCFLNCSSLALIVLDGPVVSNPTDYFANASCLGGTVEGLEIVCKCAAVSMNTGSGSQLTTQVSIGRYAYTLDFYPSIEAAETESYANQSGSITCWSVVRDRDSDGYLSQNYRVRLFDLLYNRQNYSDAIYEGEIPPLPDGKVWGVIGASNPNNHSYMTGSYKVVPVDPGDVQYGWVNSPSIDAVRSGTSSGVEGGGPNNNNEETSSDVHFEMQPDGSIPEISEVVACSSSSRGTGDSLDPSLYELVYEKATIESYMEGEHQRYTVTWDEIDVGDITDVGLYRVSARGAGGYADSSTAAATFEVVRPSPTSEVYYDSSNMMRYLGDAAYDAASSLSAGSPAYSVVVPSSDWRDQLLGAGFAGASEGPGVLLTDCGTGTDGARVYSSRMVLALNQANTNVPVKQYIVIGDEDEVPASADPSAEAYLADYVAEKCTNGTRYGSGCTSAQQTASSAISTFRPDRWGAAWGGVALVASPAEELVTEAAAQLAYAGACRVFYLRGDGTLSDDDLAALAGAGRVVLVGDESCVPASAADAVAGATGGAPARVLEGDSAAAASLGLASQMVSAGAASWSTLVVADSTEPANVSNAAVLASSLGGVMLTCRTSADAKLIESALEGLILSGGLSCVSDVRMVGGFSYLGGDPASALTRAWDVAYADLGSGPEALAPGDTFESSGVVYQATGASTARAVAYTGSASASSVPARVSWGGVGYAVTADLGALGAAVARAEAMDRSGAPAGGAEALEAAAAAARAVLADPSTSQAAADSALSALRAAMAGAVARFADVGDPSDWYYDAVYGMTALGCITGYDDEAGARIFNHGGTMDRAQMATVLWRMAGEPDSSGERAFNDCDYDDYYGRAVCWAYEAGVITGYGDGAGGLMFDPGGGLDFEAMVTMAARLAIGQEAADAWPQGVLSSGRFSDAGAVDEWARGAMAWAVDEGMVTGSGEGDGPYLIDPGDRTARGRAVTVLWRAVEAGVVPVS